MTEQAIEADPQSKKQYWQKQIENWEQSKMMQASILFPQNVLQETKFTHFVQ